MIRRDEAVLAVAGTEFLATADGALVWLEESLVVVSDLHLEKGSSFAERRQLLPPYDTAATLARLARLLARFAAKRLIFLGDSFHDRRADARLAARDREALSHCLGRREIFWIAGNHDPHPPAGFGGTATPELAIGSVLFRHEPTAHAPRARSRAISIRWRKWLRGAAHSGAAALPVTATAPSCRPLAPMPVG